VTNNDSIEKHNFKISIGIAITVIIFLLITSYNFATWKSEMEATHKEMDDRIIHIGEKIITMRSDINILKEQANGRDIQLAQINTKLANIELLLIDIKQDIKNK